MYFVSIKVLDFGEKLWKCPGMKQAKVLENKKNVLESPGKSWNFDYVFLWQPWIDIPAIICSMLR